MKRTKLGFVLIAILVLFTLVSCEWINNLIDSRTRNIALITIYNSNREKTNLLQPNDTLYVEVKGLEPGGFYTVEALDPEGKLISKLSLPADANGVIGPTPLWYDVGFKKYNDAGRWRLELPTEAELGVRAFNIHVVNEGSSAKALSMTDFKLPFFVVFNTTVTRPQPIVMAGRMVGSNFYLENAFQANNADDKVYIKVANLDSLPTPTPASGQARIYLMPFTGNSFVDGQSLTQEVFSQLVDVADLKNGVALNGTDNYTGASWTNGVIPNASKGLAYSVVVDVNDNGIYEVKKEGTTDYYLDGIDGDGIAGFLVISDPPPPITEKQYIAANIASGGTMGWDSTHSFGWWPDYDYRDKFKADGSDTRYAWDWSSGSVGYGIKAIWNPYVNVAFPQVPNSESTLYYGRYVDVWIVENDTTHPDLDLKGTNPLKAAHAGEPNGTRKLTLPVQSACDNGALQQNIWPAPMIPGDYCVVVDLDRDGKVSDYDIVDNVDSLGNARTGLSGGLPAGFSVIQ